MSAKDSEAAGGVPARERGGSSRPRLERTRIVEAAVSFIDEHGLPGLTMRRLGDQLGVEAMALDRHVPGKEDLLDAVVEALMAQMESDVDVEASPRDGGRTFCSGWLLGRVVSRSPIPRLFHL